ncbi:MAG: hypothetical protein Q9163_005495 [Psora crenata]
MSSAASVVRRALLYVPGSSQRMLAKARELTVDCVAYDLEDSVTMNKKAEARANLQHLLAHPKASGTKKCAVRINAVGSGLEEDDLAAVCTAPNLDTIIIPKVNSASDLHWAADFLTHNRPRPPSHTSTPPSQPIKILALIESARALSNLTSICQATPLLSGLIFAAEDFALDLSLTRTPSLMEFLYARSAIVTAARAYNLPSAIDLVCTSLRGPDGQRTMEEECLGGKGLGFNGKQCIHPDQVAVAQKAFAPHEKEIEWAVRVVVANDKAEGRGRGAWTLDGKMIDAPVVGKAKGILTRAGVCGVDVVGMRQKWRDQKPE